jgi:hypothetical protein
MFRIESGTGTVIDHCWSWDTQTIELALIYITRNAASGAAVPTQTVISNSGRLGPALAAGVADIELDSSCVQTLIQACGAEAGGGPLAVDLGNSANVCLVALPASAIILNQSSTTHKLYG